MSSLQRKRIQSALRLAGLALATLAIPVTLGAKSDPSEREQAIPAADVHSRFELVVSSGAAAPVVLTADETTVVDAMLRNDGVADAENVRVNVCASSGWCDEVTIAKLPSGRQASVSFDVPGEALNLAANPHFFTIRVDPDDRFPEDNEKDNVLELAKPVMKVELRPVEPQVEPEHDEVIEIAEGQTVSYDRRDYGPNGGESENLEFRDDLKFQPHPETGFLEPRESGVDGQPRTDPRVRKLDELAKPGEFIEYLVKYSHGVSMPRLPALPDKAERYSEENVRVLTERMGMFAAVRLERIEAARGLVSLLEQRGGKVLESYTLAGTLLVSAPKGVLREFEANEQVLHIENVIDGSKPPDVADGRARIGSDPYFNGGATGAGFMALLDSGVRTSHTLFTNPDHIWFTEDCVDGDGSCNDTGSSAYDPDDDCWNHGTKTAGVLTGNGDLGNDYRGVTSGWLDSWKVYGNGCGSLNTAAVLRAYDQAVLWGDQIVIAEMQSSQGATGSIAEAADDAYDAGTITIAANGNQGPGSGSARSPAVAHKAIGVGNYDVDSLSDIGSQGDGPTSDNRYKPDIQAPTNTDTASTTSNVAITNYGGTSGATPYAAGAASVFADWFNITSLTPANGGKIYASLINSGPLEWGQFNNQEGTGKFELPLNGFLYLGSRNVTRFDNDYITINVPSGSSEISAAIWWPESSGATHRDIDLYVELPSGGTSDSSISSPSVFERVDINNPLSGTRRVRIYGYDVPTGVSQTVYYAIHVR